MANKPRHLIWLRQLEHACQQVGISHLDIIIDQCACEGPLIPSVVDVYPAMPWCSLFDDLPEAGLKDIAPLLVRVDLAIPLQRHWLMGLIHRYEKDPVVLTLISVWRFQTLAGHLGQCLTASNDGYEGLLRYYDPRLFPLFFSDVLQPGQQQPWLRPAVLWSWLDRDGLPQLLAGAPDVPQSPECFSQVVLSDGQVQILECASDATLAMANLHGAFPADWGRERRFQVCYTAMLEATRIGLLLDSEREAFVIDRLQCA